MHYALASIPKIVDAIEWMLGPYSIITICRVVHIRQNRPSVHDILQIEEERGDLQFQCS